MGILTVSVKFELDNSKVEEYPTLEAECGPEGCYPDKPYFTKCGLSFKKYPKDGACDHLDCAIYAARYRAIYPVGMYCLFSIMMILIGWHETGNLLAGIQESESYLVIFGSFFILMSISPARRWLELNEYKNHEKIHGRRARRL